MRNWFGILKPMGVLLVIAMLLPVAYGADNYSPANHVARIVDTSVEPPAKMSPDDVYDGRLRVYIVEPWSRWHNTNYHRPYYHYAFLDFAVNELFSLSDTDTLVWDFEWDASNNGWSGIESDNIAVTAAVFNGDWVWGYADPPSGNPFQAYYTDACASAKPGESDYNKVEPGFTHSVFIEEGTATWCGPCTYQIDALDAIDRSNDYPMHYVALVADKVDAAYYRLDNDYNFVGYPTSFFDGGDNVQVGGWSGVEGYVRLRIEACGAREVTPLSLTVQTGWLEPDIVTAHITLTQGGFVNEGPLDLDAPTGPTEVLNDLSYEYSATCTDPNSDDVFLMWDFDGDVTDWEGPYTSGAEVNRAYAFAQLGAHSIMLKAKDTWDVESAWSDAHTVTVYLCGDADLSSGVDIDDAVWLINYIFSEGSPPPHPIEAGDADCSGGIDIDDVVFLLQYIFAQGSAPCVTCN